MAVPSFYDDHRDTGGLNARWTFVDPGSATASQANGQLEIRGSSGGAVYLNTGTFAFTDDWLITACLSWPTVNRKWCIFLHDGATTPVITSNANDDNFLVRIGADNTGDSGFFEYWAATSSGTRTGWDTVTDAWVSGLTGTGGPTWAQGDARFVFIENDGTNERFRCWWPSTEHPHTVATNGAGLGHPYLITDWVNWSSVRSDAASSCYLVYASLWDTFDYDVDVYATAVYAGKREGSVNSIRDADSFYRPHQVSMYGADSPELGMVGLALDLSQTDMIATGTGTDFDADTIKDRSGATDGGQVVYVYDGNDVGQPFRVGMASAPTEFGTITKRAGTETDNEIIPIGSEGFTAADFPSIYYHPDATDGFGRWRVVAEGLSSGVSQGLHFWHTDTANPWSGTWTHEGQILALGTTGEFDEDNINAHGLLFDGTNYHVLYAGRDATTNQWAGGLASGSDLTSLSKDGGNPIWPIEDGPHTDLTAGSTDSRTVTVTSTTGFVDDMAFVTTTTSSGTSYIAGRVRDVVSATELETYEPLTIASGAEIFGLTSASVYPNQVLDLGEDTSPRYVALCTAFRYFVLAPTEAPGGENTMYRTADDLAGPWTDLWHPVYGRGFMIAPSSTEGGDGPWASYENPTLVIQRPPTPVGLATEADTAFSVGFQKSYPAGLATSTETAQSVTHDRAFAAGLATEADSSLALTGTKAAAVGLSTATETSLALTATKAATVGLATETATAFGVSAVLSGPIGLATETDTAQAVTADRTYGLTWGTETNAAFGVSSTKGTVVGLATETTTALALTATKTAAVGLSTETVTSLAVTTAKALAVGLSTATDTALSVGVNAEIPVGQALETDTALSVSAGAQIVAGLATETDTAQAVTIIRAYTMGLATTADTALAVVTTLITTNPPDGRIISVPSRTRSIVVEV